jgi:hypothetical protein
VFNKSEEMENDHSSSGRENCFVFAMMVNAVLLFNHFKFKRLVEQPVRRMVIEVFWRIAALCGGFECFAIAAIGVFTILSTNPRPRKFFRFPSLMRLESLYFRDEDGNCWDFITPVASAAAAGLMELRNSDVGSRIRETFCTVSRELGKIYG